MLAANVVQIVIQQPLGTHVRHINYLADEYLHDTLIRSDFFWSFHQLIEK